MDRDPVTSKAERQAAADCLTDASPAGEPCALCARPLDYELHRKHHLAAVAYHLGGDPTEPSSLVPAHRTCRDRAMVPPTSRQW